MVWTSDGTYFDKVCLAKQDEEKKKNEQVRKAD